nr:MAG TPA: hypothetical protein [Caudoviricetes sp.]
MRLPSGGLFYFRLTGIIRYVLCVKSSPIDRTLHTENICLIH